jgi:hypothetical protein
MVVGLESMLVDYLVELSVLWMVVQMVDLMVVWMVS